MNFSTSLADLGNSRLLRSAVKLMQAETSPDLEWLAVKLAGPERDTEGAERTAFWATVARIARATKGHDTHLVLSAPAVQTLTTAG